MCAMPSLLLIEQIQLLRVCVKAEVFPLKKYEICYIRPTVNQCSSHVENKKAD